jgi:hypothetical protein
VITTDARFTLRDTGAGETAHAIAESIPTTLPNLIDWIKGARRLDALAVQVKLTFELALASRHSASGVGWGALRQSIHPKSPAVRPPSIDKVCPVT